MASVVNWLADAVPAFVAIVVIVAVLGLGLAAWRSRSIGWASAVSVSLADAMVATALGLIALLTLGRPLGPQPVGVNLLPFRDQILALQGQVDPVLAVVTLLGNVLLFVPLGIALAWRLPGQGAAGIALLAGVTSLGVEVSQAALDIGRLADVTDVLANSVGAALGIGLQRKLTIGRDTARRMDR